MLCSKITVIVNDLKKTHGDKIAISTIKMGEGTSAEEVKKAKLKTHGIVAKDKGGKLVAAVEGHNYGKEKVLEVLGKLRKE